MKLQVSSIMSGLFSVTLLALPASAQDGEPCDQNHPPGGPADLGTVPGVCNCKHDPDVACPDGPDLFATWAGQHKGNRQGKTEVGSDGLRSIKGHDCPPIEDICAKEVPNEGEDCNSDGIDDALQLGSLSYAIIPPPTDTQNVPMPIPDFGSVFVNFYIEENVPFDFLAVDLNIDHQLNGQLIVQLVHMTTGSEMALIHQIGAPTESPPYCNGMFNSGFNVTMDDRALREIEYVGCWPGDPWMFEPIVGTYKPFGELSTFIGETTGGWWQLELFDMYPGSSGILNGWTLNFTNVVPGGNDCNANGIPDFTECELDSDGDGVIDDCDDDDDNDGVLDGADQCPDTPADEEVDANGCGCDTQEGGCTSSCAGDFDGDGTVGASDLASVLGAWGPCPNCPQDFDGDGYVKAFDLAVLLGAWGPCPP